MHQKIRWSFEILNMEFAGYYGEIIKKICRYIFHYDGSSLMGWFENIFWQVSFEVDELHSPNVLLLLADMPWPAFKASNEGLLWLKGTVDNRLATGRLGLTGNGDVLLGLSAEGEVLPSPMYLKMGKMFFCRQHDTQVFNLQWTPNSVSKCFGAAMRTHQDNSIDTTNKFLFHLLIRLLVTLSYLEKKD